MSALLKAAALAVAAGLLASPGLAIDRFFPEFGNNGIDVQHYRLELDVKPRIGRLDATATLSILAERPLSAFRLDLRGLTVSQVAVGGRVAAFRQADGKLIVTPRTPIAEGRRFTATVSYRGKPSSIQDPTAPGDPDLRLGWQRYRDDIFVLSEPVGASTFFPANEEPTDKALFTIAITVPQGYAGVANGVLAANKVVGEKRRFVWRMAEPMTPWLATVHVNRFVLTRARTAGGTPLRVYSTPATPRSEINAYLRAGPMLTHMEGLVGRYPFAGYGSVVVDDPALGYALETQAMSTFPRGAADAGLVAHELAHQWFGNSVSVASWKDLWIAEGIATYFEVLLPSRGDPAAFHREMRSIYDYVVQENVGPAVVEAPDQMFTDRTYLRGAMVIYALKLKLGDRTLFRILRRLAADFRGGNLTSADVIRTAVQVSGDSSVRPLIRAWLFNERVPRLPGARRTARSGPAPIPDVVGLRCGRGAHRAAAHCGE